MGVYLDNKLSWDVHINELCRKITSVSYAIYRLKQVAVMEVISSYYYAQFYSRVKYGIVFWGNSSHILRVFRVQKRIIRTIAGVSRASTCRSFFKKFRVLTVPSLYIYISLKYWCLSGIILQNFLRISSFMIIQLDAAVTWYIQYIL